jgi:hypothetical protein
MPETAQNGEVRLTWDAAHRLELSLRARAERLAHASPTLARCPGCGQTLSAGDERISVGGIGVHPGCVPDCGTAFA